MEPLLIVGVPRSGTTWTGRVLGHTEGVAYVNEPDGFRDPFAFGVMVARGENPILAAGDAAADCERLWSGAFGGGRPAGLRQTLRTRGARSPQRRHRRPGSGSHRGPP